MKKLDVKIGEQVFLYDDFEVSRMEMDEDFVKQIHQTDYLACGLRLADDVVRRKWQYQFPVRDPPRW